MFALTTNTLAPTASATAGGQGFEVFALWVFAANSVAFFIFVLWLRKKVIRLEEEIRRLEEKKQLSSLQANSVDRREFNKVYSTSPTESIVTHICQ